jgi:Uma2 family endonuclease
MGLPLERLTLPEYLAWENEQVERHEFYAGEVFAMVGARRVHLLVTGNLFAALKAHLKGTGCRAFSEAGKLQVADDKLFYPDVFVSCDESDLKTEMIFRHPTLVAEVLSESTQAFDRGKKFAAYRSIASLREYVLIDPDSREVSVYRRNERGNFELIDQTGAGQIELDSLQFNLPMAELFDGVDEGQPGPGAAA